MRNLLRSILRTVCVLFGFFVAFAACALILNVIVTMLAVGGGLFALGYTLSVGIMSTLQYLWSRDIPLPTKWILRNSGFILLSPTSFSSEMQFDRQIMGKYLVY
jgi:hypothetical protein